MPQLRKNFKDLTGKTLGVFLVTSYAGKSSDGCRRSLWNCVCTLCNNTTILRSDILTGNLYKSCGCVPVIGNTKSKPGANVIHGNSLHELYDTWRKMIKRCYDSEDKDYVNYGARGIKVCKEWISSFESFVNDLGKRPDGLSLDRVNVNWHYCKENCRWADKLTQTLNSKIRLEEYYATL